jgi:hypothetical protein
LAEQVIPHKRYEMTFQHGIVIEHHQTESAEYIV